MSIELVMPSNHLILCRPLLLLLPIPPSIKVFFNESALRIMQPKYWSFSFSISPTNEHPGLISFRKDWLDLLAVQGTLKSLLQHYSWKASVLQHSAFFIVQLSHQYMVTGKTIALMRWTFVDKVMSLLFNMLSRLVIAFLSSSKRHFFGEMEFLRENGCRYRHSDHAESLQSKTQFASNPPEWGLAAWSFHSRPHASFCETCQEERHIKTENKNLRRNKDR